VTAPRRRAPSPLGTPLTLSLVVVLVLATFGGFAAGFGVLQTCSDLYGTAIENETIEGDPCAAAESWVNRGWALQGVLLLVGLGLALLARRGVAARAVGWAGWLLGPVSIALLIATTSMANGSY
jgi:hypothetical protein